MNVGGSKEYLVTWAIELDANSPEEAARTALEIQRDPSSLALHFTVAEIREDGYVFIEDEAFVDLTEEAAGVIH